MKLVRQSNAILIDLLCIAASFIQLRLLVRLRRQIDRWVPGKEAVRLESESCTFTRHDGEICIKSKRVPCECIHISRPHQSKCQYIQKSNGHLPSTRGTCVTPKECHKTTSDPLLKSALRFSIQMGRPPAVLTCSAVACVGYSPAG